MGKRKKATKVPGKKKNEPLPTNFTCLFCNHEKSITVKLSKKEGVGQLNCKTCGQTYQCAINYLSHPVDVYSDWVDACDAVAKKGGEQIGSERTVAAARASGRGAGVNEDGNLDGLIDDDGVERDRSQEAMVGDDEDDDY